MGALARNRRLVDSRPNDVSRPAPTGVLSKPQWSFGPSDVMKMIAMQPPNTAQNPDREGGDPAPTALRLWIIFDGADVFLSRAREQADALTPHPRLNTAALFPRVLV